jgi:hypothetical protein
MDKVNKRAATFSHHSKGKHVDAPAPPVSKSLTIQELARYCRYAIGELINRCESGPRADAALQEQIAQVIAERDALQRDYDKIVGVCSSCGEAGCNEAAIMNAIDRADTAEARVRELEAAQKAEKEENKI